MSLTKNIRILEKKLPAIRRLLSESRADTDRPNIEIKETRAGINTLYYSAIGNEGYLHSRYNPKEEAERFVAQFTNLDNKVVLFIGMGLGYYIEAFVKRFPEIPFWVYEPSIAIVDIVLHMARIDYFKGDSFQGFCMGTDEQQIQTFVNSVFKNVTIEVEIVIPPSYEKYFEKEIKSFQNEVYKRIKQVTEFFYTGIAFEERIITNGLMNAATILNTPNFQLDVDRTHFAGKPAIIVAAGPSLNDEIENLRYIKEHKLAYIFAVGSANNTLLSHNIYPDAITTYDPTELNAKVVERVKEQNITSIPLIFGSRVGFETIEDYPGHLLHFIVKEDRLCDAYLSRNDGVEIQKVFDAPSIAIMTFQLLASLGAHPIILVGQNLAYRNDERYSSGITYYSQSDEEKLRQQLVDVEDVTGGVTKTIVAYNMMRTSLEDLITHHQSEVINTTIGGAKIKGAEFKYLKDVIKERLKESVVQDEWFPKSFVTKYNLEYFYTEATQLEDALTELKQIVNDMQKILRQLRNHTDHRQANKITKTIERVDQQLKVFFSNKGFEKIIIVMTNTHLQVLLEVLEKVRFEPNPFMKGDQIHTELTSYFTRCESVISEVLDYFTIMNEKVSDIAPATEKEVF